MDQEESFSRALGREIAAARVRRGMTQRDLAEVSGFSVSGIRNWELGVRTPTVAHLILLARSMNTSAGAMMDAAQKTVEEGTGS